MTIPAFPETRVALKGRKGLIVGIANDQSIAWGCAKAFRALGAELAVTYLNERARKHVEPLAKELEAPIFMPLDVNAEGQTEQVFEQMRRSGAGLTSSCTRLRSPRKRHCTGAWLMFSATASSRRWTCPAGHSCVWRIWRSR